MRFLRYILLNNNKISTPPQHIAIVKACLNGSRAAQELLYIHYSSALYGTCLRIVSRVPEAEDMLQETYIRIFENLSKFDLKANFYTWAKRIAINCCINHQKKRGINYSLTIEAGRQLDEVEQNYSEENVNLSVDVVKEALKLLPNGYRVIFSLYLLEGYDHTEISKILNISVSTSKSQYARAKKKLKLIIIEQDG